MLLFFCFVVCFFSFCFLRDAVLSSANTQKYAMSTIRELLFNVLVG
jgi:hypothetical protein